MLNISVGESGDRLLRAKKVFQQAEKNEKAATQIKSRTADKLQRFGHTDEVSEVRKKEEEVFR